MALLAFLALQTDRASPRERLCGLLWPDSGDDQARASLRQAISQIRKAFGDAATVVVSTRDALHIDHSRVDSDVAEFLKRSEAQTIDGLQEGAHLYRGDLLDGIGPVTPEYDRWLEAERGALRSRYSALLLRLADLFEADGNIGSVISTALALLALDPLQEHVHRRLMRCYRAQGRADAALKQFEKLRAVLTTQLGVEPEEPTVDLARQIRRDRHKGARPRQEGRPTEEMPADQGKGPAGRGVTAPGRPSIGVLRFRGVPAGGDAEVLGEGISEDVTIDLSREPDILVVSRQSSFALDEENMTARQIGDQLGIRFYLRGVVRQFGERLRVTAHLVSCETGHEVWAERFDRDLADFFEIQSEIARVVAATAADRVAANVVETSARGRPDNLKSYELVLRGIREVHRFSADGYLAAQGLFEQAIERSPDYGRAHGWLALSKLYLRWNIDASIDLSDVTVVAERAVALDPRDPKGHLALAMCSFIDRQFDRAEFHFQSALGANPNDELVLTEYGRFLMYLDRPEDGLRRIREAMRVNPFFPGWFWTIRGRCLHTLGRYEEAAHAFERVRSPPFYIHAYLAACYTMTGRSDAAASARAALYEARPDFDLAAFKAIFPYKNPATSDRLFRSFETAGLA